MYPQSPSKWQLSEQERRGEITPAEYYRALQERSDALNFAAKRKPGGGKKKESGSKDDPKCSADNYQCRGSKGVACISKKKGCRADLDKQVVSPERKQYINDTIEKLKEAGKSPPKVRIGRKLGAPITDISWEQYAKALELNVSGRKLSVGDATREQLKAIGVDVDGLTAKPAQGKKEELMEGRVTFSGIGAESPPSKEVLRKVAETQADARTKSYYGTMQNVKDIPPDQLYTGVARYLEAVQSRKNENPNDILLVKNGDFYMTYFDDAHKLAASLGRAPQGTQLLKDLPPIEERSSTPTSVQSDGFPDHALGRYGADILAAGFNIVVADVPDAAPEPTPPQTKLQKAAAEKAARSVEDMATQMSDALRNGSALPETVKAIANDPDTDPDRRAAARQALAAANRARELDPKFEMVGSNFVDLDNPAEVEQLRRFYGGEVVGKPDGRPQPTAIEKMDQTLKELGWSSNLPPGKQGLVMSLESIKASVDRLNKDNESGVGNPSSPRSQQGRDRAMQLNERLAKDLIDSIEAFDQMSKALETGDPKLVPSMIGDRVVIPDRVKEWIKKQPAFDLRDFESSKESTIIGSPITELLLRGKGETLSSANGVPQKITRVSPPSSKFPQGSITLVAQDSSGKRRTTDLGNLHDLLRYSPEELSSGGFPSWMGKQSYDFSESSLIDLGLRF